ncbi:MAG: hypothetical protein FWC16_09415 [Defluviitaleaceae bacterium]|nr:hypothetical protein [Defluviitaleaceae bacterium]MCL2275130.1 hypothetical protein [Defluviitaleaceae bacterium]
MTCAILHHSLHRRTYKNAAVPMAINEILHLFPAAINPREAAIGNVPYLLFNHGETLAENDIALLSRLTFTHAIFDYTPPALTPLNKTPNYLLDESLSALLKYAGKTNELFTRLLLHLAVQNKPAPLNILDPLAGKGTTLYEALIHHHNAYGVEIDEKYPAEADQFLKKFLETARIKHTTHKEKIHGASRYKIDIQRTNHFEIIQGDTRNTAIYFKKNFFDALIADLPYGVQHASKAVKNKKPHSGFTRNAMGLLQEALPTWVKTLKPNGTLVLAWNTFLISRGEMEALLTTHGLILSNVPDFSHRVDQAIERDVIVGVKV